MNEDELKSALDIANARLYLARDDSRRLKKIAEKLVETCQNLIDDFDDELEEIWYSREMKIHEALSGEEEVK